ncbi:MAG: DUF72 domain-containing protein [Actinomycetota bacterium]
MADVRIGISGWRYPPWRGVFYPAGLPQRDELAHVAHIFRSVEVNGTFYSLRRPADYAAWAAQVPADFIFALKAPRYITHRLRLKEFRTPLANFLASGLLALGPRLGPILWQFPPNFTFDRPRIEAWLAGLPHDTDAAAALARLHDAKVAGRAVVEPASHGPLRHAMEIRHPSFVCAEFVELLRHYRVALVCADSVEWPRLMDVTADFVYCRLHGSEQLYASGYDLPALAAWAGRVLAWAGGAEPADAERAAGPAPEMAPRDVFVYFDNDAKVRAPADAQALRRLVIEHASAGDVTA